MASNDAPLVIERGNKLPARDKHQIIIIGYVMRVERRRGRLTSTVHQRHARVSTPRLVERSRLANVLC